MGGIDGRAIGGAHPGHILQIFDGDGQAREQAPCIGARRRRQGPLRAEGGHGMDRTVRGGDARQGSLDQILGLDLAPLHQIYRCPRRQAEELASRMPPCLP